MEETEFEIILYGKIGLSYLSCLDGSQAGTIFTTYLFDCFTFLFLLVGIELRLKFKYFTLLGGRKVLGVGHFDLIFVIL